MLNKLLLILILANLKYFSYSFELLSIETHNVDGSKTQYFDSIKKFLEEKSYSIFKRVGPTTLFALN